jgi:aminoglycoside phosphotransferase (APT) family kinase protein
MIAGVDLSALMGWMDTRGLGEGPITEVCALSGGTQNILVRFVRGGRAFVLRRPPLALRANSNETMRREARVLTALAGSAVPHARLIAACPEEDVLGAAFYLMEPVEGFNPTTGLPPLHAGDRAVRHRILLAMVEGIARLGAIDYRAVGLDGLGRPENFLERQVGRWQAQLASYADMPGWPGAAALPGVSRIAAWLEAHRPSHYQPGILHGDFHLSNVMVRPDSGELAAIVDWELCTIGDPLLDLGWLLATLPEGDQPLPTDLYFDPWEGHATPEELAAHYGRMSGRDLSALDWYVVLACYKLGVILEGTYARACAGKAPRATSDRLHAHTIDLFERALRRIV